MIETMPGTTKSPPATIAPGRRWRRVVGFALQRPAPRIERVVHHHTVLEHRVVVGEIGGKTERQRKQTRRLRGKFETRGIGASDDQGQRVERRVLDAVDLE